MVSFVKQNIIVLLLCITSIIATNINTKYFANYPKVGDHNHRIGYSLLYIYIG